MKCDLFDIQSYLERIGVRSSEIIQYSRLDLVRKLMKQQLFSVPFENICVQKGHIVSLEPDDIYNKIVIQKQGGYCYELNGLFAMAMSHYDIPYQLVAARPMFYPMLRPKTHMALVVTVEGKRLLVDLGFGSYGIREPIDLNNLETVIQQDLDQFMLSQDESGEYILKAFVDGEWKRQYGFNLSQHLWVDFIPANYLNSTHPDAIFVQKHLLIKPSPEGRVILLGNTLKSVTQSGSKILEIEEKDKPSIILKYFGISI